MPDFEKHETSGEDVMNMANFSGCKRTKQLMKLFNENFKTRGTLEKCFV